MRELEPFCVSCLGQWERRSTVRNMGRFHPTEADAEAILLPSDWLACTEHPSIAVHGEEGRRYLAARWCYRMMEEIALLETDMVGDCCRHLANEAHSVDLSEAVRQTALTIQLDEIYHTFVAREFIGEMSQLNGVAPEALPLQSGPEIGLDAALNELPAELHGVFKIVALSLTENTITAEIMGLSKDTTPDNPFHHMLREHLIDEVRHQRFFRLLLKHVWAAFDPHVRRHMIAAIPVFLDNYLERGRASYTETQIADLVSLGVERPVAKTVLAEALPPGYSKSDHPMWSNMRAALQAMGLLADTDLCATLDDAGWLTA